MEQSDEIKAGDLWVAYADHRPASRVFITVTRVAKDKIWADIRCLTWAVEWTKRQKLTDGGLPSAVKMNWGPDDLEQQEADHMAESMR